MPSVRQHNHRLWRLIHLARRLQGGMTDATEARQKCLAHRQQIVLQAITSRLEQLNDQLDIPPTVLLKVVRAYPWTPDAIQWQADLRSLLRSKKLEAHRPVLRIALQVAEAQANDMIIT